MRFTKKQLQAFAETLVIYNQRRSVALVKQRKNLFYTEAIPLKKLYSRWNAKCRQPILCAIDTVFERVSRGNNITKISSRWVPRKDTYVKEEHARLLRQLYDDNKEHIVSVKDYVYAKDDKTLVVSTELVFPSPEVREVFASYVAELETKSWDAARPNRKPDIPDIQPKETTNE